MLFYLGTSFVLKIIRSIKGTKMNLIIVIVEMLKKELTLTNICFEKLLSSLTLSKGRLISDLCIDHTVVFVNIEQ